MEISPTPPASKGAKLPSVSALPCKVVRLLTTDELPLTWCYHPKPTVYLTVQSWLCTFCGFAQTCTVITLGWPESSLRFSVISHELFGQPNSIHCPKNPQRSTYSPPFPTPHSQATTDLFTVSIVLPFPRCRIVGTTQYASFSDCLLSLSNNMHLIHLFTACWLIPFQCWKAFHCLDVPQFMFPFTYWMDILAASKFWQLWIKLL